MYLFVILCLRFLSLFFGFFFSFLLLLLLSFSLSVEGGGDPGWGSENSKYPNQHFKTKIAKSFHGLGWYSKECDGEDESSN